MTRAVEYRADHFLQSRLTWCLAAVIAIYGGLSVYYPIGPLTEVFRVLQMSFALTVVIAYFRNAFNCFFYVGRWPPREDLISLGICAAWASVAANGAWGLLWRLSGQPVWMMNNDWFNSWIALNSCAAVLHILAPNLLGRDVPRLQRGSLIGLWLLTFTAIALVTIARPDAEGLTDYLRVMMEEPEWSMRSVDTNSIRRNVCDPASGVYAN